MKVCTRCKQSLPFEMFSTRGKGHQSMCRPCNKVYQREHYLANRQAYIDKERARRQGFAQMCRDLKESTGCTDCGVKYPYYVLHFDHIGLEEKIADVSKLRQRGSLKKLQEEILKCEVVCANCHAKRTHARQHGPLV